MALRWLFSPSHLDGRVVQIVHRVDMLRPLSRLVKYRRGWRIGGWVDGNFVGTFPFYLTCFGTDGVGGSGAGRQVWMLGPTTNLDEISRVMHCTSSSNLLVVITNLMVASGFGFVVRCCASPSVLCRLRRDHIRNVDKKVAHLGLDVGVANGLQ